jgi:hypothetical protein
MRLGSSGKVDYLAVGVSAVDAVGHMYGTEARERVDTVWRMHEELGAFLRELRGRFGSRLSVVLTSDHGLTPMATDEKRLRVTQGGTVDVTALIQKVTQALDGELGPRPEGWVASIDGSALALKPPFTPRAVELAAETMRQEPGIWQAIVTSHLEGADGDARHSVYPGRSGQVLIVVRPLWTLKKPTDGADHGSPWNDDALVPLYVQVPGFRFRREPRFRATQVAPTMSLLLGAAPPAAALDVPAIEPQ